LRIPGMSLEVELALAPPFGKYILAYFPILGTVEIPNSCAKSKELDSCRCLLLRETGFFEGIRVRDMSGLNECFSLSRIEIPSPVRVLRGLNQCKSLIAIFVEDSSLRREIAGSNECSSLEQITIPHTVE
jgi:hypothetical protein